MMGSEVGQHPGGRAATLADDRGQLVERAVGQLAAADAGRLQHAEETGRMQIGDRLVGQPAKLLGPGGALAQNRDQRFGAPQQLFEARRRRALVGFCLGHCAPLPDRRACAILLLASQLGDILFTWGLVKP